jgi:nucleotide-binding universal stress UspA family protein
MDAAVALVVDRAWPSADALSLAVQESRARSATLHVLCVVPLDVETGLPPNNLRDFVQRLSRALGDRASDAGVRLCMHVTGAAAADALAASIKGLGAEIVVLNHKPPSTFFGWTPESLAKKMLDLSSCPVLVVR